MRIPAAFYTPHQSLTHSRDLFCKLGNKQSLKNQQNNILFNCSSLVLLGFANYRFSGTEKKYFTLLMLPLLANSSNARNPNGTKASITISITTTMVFKWCLGWQNRPTTNMLKMPAIHIYQHSFPRIQHCWSYTSATKHLFNRICKVTVFRTQRTSFLRRGEEWMLYLTRDMKHFSPS